MKYLLSVVIFSVLWVALAAQELLLEPCTAADHWVFVNGGEFPGAAGALATGPQGQVDIRYNFEKGGRYVAAISRFAIPAAAENLTVNLLPEQSCDVNLRLVDANGRVFQKYQQTLKGDEPAAVNVKADDNWSSVWGGNSESQVAAPPFKELWVMPVKNDALPLQGKVTLSSVYGDGKALATSGFAGDNFTLKPGSGQVDGKWIACAQGAALALVCSTDFEPLAVSVNFPVNGRDLVQNFKVTSPQSTLLISLPADNLRNCYQIEVTARQSKNSAGYTVELKGKNALPVLTQKPKTSEQISSNRFGSCTHFSYGTHGSFAGWSDWKTLIDSLNECGMRVIREEVLVEPGPDGALRVRPYDLGWVRYAKNKGIEVIAIIELNADKSLADFLDACAAVVRDTKGLVNVYELGNEPNNFGNWIKHYGGTWNGKEPDNSTSPWVLAHLKYTNAAAEAIKNMRSDAVVIGTGAVAPTNIRYLQSGLSPAVDGIAEHPYAFSLPPEKVPYGLQLAKRDGIAMGDQQHSFAGLIHSYEDYFAKTKVKRSLYITEFGFTTFRFNGKNETALYAGYGEEAQAVYLLRRQLLTLGLPVIKASLQYDYLDDYYSKAHEPEANFGLLRGDGSKKIAWYVMQRFNTLLADTVADSAVKVKVDAPLHRAAERGELIKNWDNVKFEADNEIMSQPLTDPATGARFLAVWSAQPYNGEFNNRSVSLTIEGVKATSSPWIALDLITGRSFDVVAVNRDGIWSVKTLELGNHPLLLLF